MLAYYAGIHASPLFEDKFSPLAIDRFTEIPFPGITDVEIGWDYLLLWQGTKLYISEHLSYYHKPHTKIMLLEISEHPPDRIKRAVTGRECIILVTENNDVWQYKMGDLKKAPRFISNDNNMEFVSKIDQGGAAVALTNLGRVCNIPTLVDMPVRVKFIDIACGFDHTILLAENGDVYSMGIGTRGQLGHGDLDDYDNPTLINALAGLNVVQISVGGWHSAVVTDQGDLYTWGWNTHGELGFHTEETKVVPIPTLIDFKDTDGENVEINVKKVQCGNVFTICLMDDGSFWGCGSNKYGQLGQPRTKCKEYPLFSKLDIPLDLNSVKDFKCREWGTVIFTE